MHCMQRLSRRVKYQSDMLAAALLEFSSQAEKAASLLQLHTIISYR